MKNTIKSVFILSIVCAAAAALSSCENVMALGKALNLKGPKVTIDTLWPKSRQAVDGIFVMKGTLTDNTGVADMIIKARYNKPVSLGSSETTNEEFGVWWRYTPDGEWEYSLDSGDSWLPLPPATPTGGTEVEAEWTGTDKDGQWMLPINMKDLLGEELVDGQYNFSVIATNTAGNSDDNSFATRAVILYKNPSLIDITLPQLYSDELGNDNELDILEDDEILIPKLKNTAFFGGKIQNSRFNLQWRITEKNDVYSVDIRFYEKSKDVLGVDESDYIYRMFIHDVRSLPPTFPEETDPSGILLPNGRILVPDMSKPLPPGVSSLKWTEDGINHELRSSSPGGVPVSAKTTLQVVARCVNAAGLVKDDSYKIKGKFVYWPETDDPWISFPNVIDEDTGPSNPSPAVKMAPYMQLTNNAYDDNGIDRVEYKIWRVDNPGTWDETTPGTPIMQSPAGGVKCVDHTVAFFWPVEGPAEAAVYFMEATVYEYKDPAIYTDPADIKSSTSKGYFEIKNSSFPDIRKPYTPDDSQPLFAAISGTSPDNWQFTIEGYATDFTGIKNVTMVWINPKSINYAAMSQLAFFRDALYGYPPSTPDPSYVPFGWYVAPASDSSPAGLDTSYSTTAPNKVWTMKLENTGQIEDDRKVFKYSKTLRLKEDLSIDPSIASVNDAYAFLKSQVFVLKATDSDNSTDNPYGKSHIITWAPRGDSQSPEIKITGVTITGGGRNESLTPGTYTEPIDLFDSGQVVTVRGIWAEDCNGPTPLDILQSVFRNQLLLTVNGHELGGTPTLTTTKTVARSTVRGAYAGGVNYNFGDVVTYGGDNYSCIIYSATGTTGTILGVPAAGNKNWSMWTSLGPYGTFTGTATVGTNAASNALTEGNLRDTLVASVEVTDIGGNKSENGASWLITSEKLKFLRVGSDESDGTYTFTKTGDPASGDRVIDIFLEFNKPVILKPGRSPVLYLNVTGGAAGSDIAVYNPGHPDHHKDSSGASTRQHFTYEVKTGNTTSTTNPAISDTNLRVLNLRGINTGGLAYTHDDYPFVWDTATGGESIRMVTGTVPTNPPTGMTVNGLPVSIPAVPPATSDPADYLFTLMSGKRIRIDTLPPLLAAGGVTASVKPGWYKAGDTIYVTVKFNEQVFFSSGSIPKLTMNISNKNAAGTITRTSTETTTAQLNNDSIFFSYEIQDGDFTPGTPEYGGELQITGVTGGYITDLAGNRFTAAAGLLDTSRSTLSSVYVKAITPPTPTVNVRSSSSVVNNDNRLGTSADMGTPVGVYTWDPTLYSTSKIFNDAFKGDWASGDPYNKGDIVTYGTTNHYYCLVANSSTTTPASNTAQWAVWASGTSTPRVNLQNLYIQSLFLQIVPTGVLDSDYERIEYSTNYGRDWGLYTAVTERTNLGNYEITARQVDAAGNVSPWSKPITFLWDKGDLLTRISSANPNGIYTNTQQAGGTRIDTIDIDLYFRVPVKFSIAPTFSLNVGGDIHATEWVDKPVSNKWTFTYTVGQNDNTPAGQVLALNSMSIETDSITDDLGVDVVSMVNLTYVNTNSANLQHLKEITVQTGVLTRTNGPVFQNYSDWGFQGINPDNDTYSTSLLMEFDKPVSKGGTTLDDSIPNVIKIIQKQDGYRLPAVLNLTQAVSYRTALAARGYVLNNYYEEGTNGYVNGTGVDISTKYILKPEYDPYNIVPAESTPAAEISLFAEAFRQAEMVEIPINSVAVEISEFNQGGAARGRVIVRLTGSNALKVPGAEYEVSFPAGMVQDVIGNPSVAYPVEEETGLLSLPTTGMTTTVPNIAKPFVRIQRPQEDYMLSTELVPSVTASQTQPRILVKDWNPASATGIDPVLAYAYARLDCRTPLSSVTYLLATPLTTNVTTAPGNTLPGSIPTYTGANDPTRPTATMTLSTATVYGATTTPLQMGSLPNSTTNLYQGYSWRIVAAARTGTGTTGIISTAADRIAEEIVYRSVLTFVGQTVPITGTQFANGDQLWVRGGNTINGSTIPGFPLTYQDNFTQISTTPGKRAGIRLMHKTSTGNLNNSTWQWVTWDIRNTTYYNIFLAHDDTSSAAVARKYGPKQFAAQNGNWTSLIVYYPLFPGGHRYIASEAPKFDGSGSSRVPPFSFNGTYDQRADLTTVP